MLNSFFQYSEHNDNVNESDHECLSEEDSDWEDSDHQESEDNWDSEDENCEEVEDEDNWNSSTFDEMRASLR